MKKYQSIILVFLMSLLVIGVLFFGFFYPRWFENNDYPYYGHMIGGWGMPFGMLAMGIFWIGVIYFIFNGINSQQEHRENRAVEALKTRLAKGEITIDEYEKLMDIVRDK